jgi:cell wall-associated NlpC family hydrolase
MNFHVERDRDTTQLLCLEKAGYFLYLFPLPEAKLKVNVTPQDLMPTRIFFLLTLAFWSAFMLTSCESKHTPHSKAPVLKRTQLPALGYTIQVGAFAQVDNASRLTRKLEGKGLDAYYFQQAGLYKVRFGDFVSRVAAQDRAQNLQAAGCIADYYIVRPRNIPGNREALRTRIVITAQKFLGVPYEWGGTKAEHGFDCSGLTMAVYRLNGLRLPRTSRQQYSEGLPVNRNKLNKGDLVFFDPPPKGRISHVGVYAGNGRFIHAPGTGKTVRFSSLSSRYYTNAYAGGRTYIHN